MPSMIARTGSSNSLLSLIASQSELPFLANLPSGTKRATNQDVCSILDKAMQIIQERPPLFDDDSGVSSFDGPMPLQ